MLSEGNTQKWLFRAFDRMHHNCLKAELNRAGLSEASHPPILGMLLHEAKGRTATQKEIADAVGISPPTVAVSVRRMEKAGLLRKVTDQSDQRRNLVTLTEKGVQIQQACEEAFDRVDDAVLNGFSDNEKAQLRGFYLRMIANLEEIGAQLPAMLKSALGR